MEGVLAQAEGKKSHRKKCIDDERRGEERQTSHQSHHRLSLFFFLHIYWAVDFVATSGAVVRWGSRVEGLRREESLFDFSNPDP